MPKAESGLTLGRLSRSVKRTKKCPWKVCRDIPRVHRIRITALNPICLWRVVVGVVAKDRKWFPGPEDMEFPGLVGVFQEEALRLKVFIFQGHCS